MNIADEYFNRCRQISITNNLNPFVRYKVFARKEGVVCGANKVVNFIKDNTFGPLKIEGSKDGEFFHSKETVLQITGLFQELVNLETTYLGMLSFSGVATGMNEIVEAARGIPVIDMSPRHFPWQIIEEVAYAAALGGASGTSSRAGYNYVQKWRPNTDFKLYGSIPHALNAVCEGSSVEAAKLYKQQFPDIPLTVLIDFEGKELDVCTEAYKTFGKDLYAVRLDTHGGRICQGCRDISYSTILTNLAKSHMAGAGVTIEATKVVREHLDKIGAKDTKIIVSSGFDVKKIRTFVNAKAPMDAIGTGSSWVKFMMFTADIAEVFINGKWIDRCKAERAHGPLANDHILFERK